MLLVDMSLINKTFISLLIKERSKIRVAPFLHKHSVYRDENFLDIHVLS